MRWKYFYRTRQSIGKGGEEFKMASYFGVYNIKIHGIYLNQVIYKYRPGCPLS